MRFENRPLELLRLVDRFGTLIGLWVRRQYDGGFHGGLRVPELIELFSNRELRALALHFLQSPQQFAWLIDFQRNLQPARSALLR
ncbi:hypothetical protein [Paraburkholderia sp. EG304]|uniref:hypothetical protein n=1 Tax=Paraburkholderia sp. EG304 TaxID=3237015 RepID=UPI0039798D0A